jgi:hypothetical protein
MFQPAEKACWEILLREYPDFRDVSQAALDSSMEKTLQQLWAVLTVEPVEEWLRTQDNETPLSARGDCALNALLPFFNTGQHALELVGKELSESCPEISEGDRGRVTAEISAAFKLLVHWQLQGACSRCHQAPQCRFGDRDALSTVALVKSQPAAPPPARKARPAVAKAVRVAHVVSEVANERGDLERHSPDDAKPSPVAPKSRRARQPVH